LGRLKKWENGHFLLKSNIFLYKASLFCGQDVGKKVKLINYKQNVALRREFWKHGSEPIDVKF
jgi:hypothetical protein